MQKKFGYFFHKAFFLSLCGIHQAQRKSFQRVVDGRVGGRMHFGVTQIPGP